MSKREFGIVAGVIGMALLAGGSCAQDEAREESAGDEPGRIEKGAASIWESKVGEGFRPGAQTMGFSLGTNIGFARDPENESHQLAMAAISYSRIIMPVWGEGRWYKGNWEVRGELFGGEEYSPEHEWFVGLTPVLRYNFATGEASGAVCGSRDGSDGDEHRGAGPRGHVPVQRAGGVWRALFFPGECRLEWRSVLRALEQRGHP